MSGQGDAMIKVERLEGDVVVHGGAGADKRYEDGCLKAALAARVLLRGGGSALDAVVAAVTTLEDDGRFNAGTGSHLGLDGATIEMDASVMDSTGRLGAVACLQAVRNPVQVARAVADTPHHLLCGHGALLLARHLGHAPYYEVSERQRQEHRALLAQIEASGAATPGVDNADFARFWNYDVPPAFRSPAACDTVGAVARDGAGHFAVAGSTGGASPTLLGRVGDTAIVGSGFYAGPQGAVAVTGMGEHFMRPMLARTVYQWLAEGIPLEQALRSGVALFDKEIDVGLIAITATEAGSASNRDMPCSALSG
jgi:L-asparaginase/beta-aspartyl-peptidase (threonine type)